MNKVSIYTKKGCPKCDHLKGLLSGQQNAEITIKDTSIPENALWLKSRDINTVPVLVIYNEAGKDLTVTFGFTKTNIANKFLNHTGSDIFV